MSSCTELYDLPESVRYDISSFDKFDLAEDQITESYESLVDHNIKLQHDNLEYNKLIYDLRSKLKHLEFKCQSQDQTICALQQQLTMQRSSFDKKFNDFLVCANDYDQKKSHEITILKQTKATLSQQYSALHGRYAKLQANLIRNSASQYKAWKWCDIYEWIINLNDERLNKYQDVLFSNLKAQQINGATLASLNDDDLYYLGIKNHNDRQILASYVARLVGIESNHRDTVESVTSSITATSDLSATNHSHSLLAMSGAMDDTSTASNEHRHKSLTPEQLKQIRIRQQNIVYVVGLPVSLCNAKLLKSEKWFGKFGAISRICFNTSPKCVKANSIPTFVTYTNEYDADQAIQKMNLFCLSDGTRLKTNYGRTKYCPAFCEAVPCLNGKCKFLHQFAKYEDIITEQEINDFNAIRAGPPSRFNKK